MQIQLRLKYILEYILSETKGKTRLDHLDRDYISNTQAVLAE